MRRDRQRLNDILEALDWIAKAIAGRTEAVFLADETLCYAVAQKLTIIGEAVARLSPEIRARYNSVPRPDIVGLRNILVHEYCGCHHTQNDPLAEVPQSRSSVSTCLGAY